MIITELEKIHSIVLNNYKDCSNSREYYHTLDNNDERSIADDFMKRKSIYNVEFHNFNEFYFGLIKSETPILWTFFIKPEFRNKETHFKMFNELRSLVGNKILAGCEVRNIPAYKFLKKYSKQYIEEIDGFLLDLECICLGWYQQQ